MRRKPTVREGKDMRGHKAPKEVVLGPTNPQFKNLELSKLRVFSDRENFRKKSPEPEAPRGGGAGRSCLGPTPIAPHGETNSPRRFHAQGPFPSYLAFSFDDNDRHSCGRPAVFGW